MNILSVNDHYPPHHVGGAEITTHITDRMMTRRGHLVHVLTTYPCVPTESPIDVAKVSWVKRRETGLPILSLLADFYLTPLRMAWRILRILRRERIDVIHATNGMAALSVWYATRISNNMPPAVLSLVSYLHVCPFGDLLYSRQGVPCENLTHLKNCIRLRTGKVKGIVLHLFALFQKLNAALLKKSTECFDSFIARSNELRAIHIERSALHQEQCEVVYPSLLERSFRSVSGRPIEARSANGTRNVLYVGRLAWQKGILVLSEAMKIVWKAFPDTQLIVVGTGPLTDYFQTLIESSEMEKVSLVGFVAMEEVWRYYEIADVVVVPSVWREPFGRVALEAMSLGKPVVASNIGGLKEVVGDCGILVQPDNAEELSQGIMRALSEEALRNRLASEGPRRVADLFGENRSTTQVESIYSRAVR